VPRRGGGDGDAGLSSFFGVVGKLNEARAEISPRNKIVPQHTFKPSEKYELTRYRYLPFEFYSRKISEFLFSQVVSLRVRFSGLST
jgi:hypothetical protein